jgi:ABC-2 type transporter
MDEIVRIARNEQLIVVCTIHQPSTKVYNSFDQLMILSCGREAYNGNVKGATDYFDSIGYPCPKTTNPAEHFLDLVNSDFSDENTVLNILDTWEQLQAEEMDDHHTIENRNQPQHMERLTDPMTVSFIKQVSILFRRHFYVVIRDPILYVGRFMVFLFANSLFAFVYWNARADTQDQAINKIWALMWCMAVPMNMAAVGVYVLNDEYKSISRESKNGMMNGMSYALAKTLLVFPILILFALFSIAIPLFAIQSAPIEMFGYQIVFYAALFWVYESLAEFLSVAFDDAILGMLGLTCYWFGSFLFGGIYISVDDMYPPFSYFYYILPFSYFLRSSVYQYFANLTFEPCTDPSTSAVCTPDTSGLAVLDQVSLVFPLFTSEDTSAVDLAVLIAMGGIFKIMYFVFLAYKTNKFMQLSEKNGIVSESIVRQIESGKSKGYQQVKNSRLGPNESTIDEFDC